MNGGGHDLLWVRMRTGGVDSKAERRYKRCPNLVDLFSLVPHSAPPSPNTISSNSHRFYVLRVQTAWYPVSSTLKAINLELQINYSQHASSKFVKE